MSDVWVDKDFWVSFIDLYKGHPCLWDIKHVTYMQKDLKNAAYEVLVEKLKEKISDANVDMVKKKINNMRSSLRKEIKKVVASKEPGPGARAEEVHQPSLWYYDHLLFLRDLEMPRRSKPKSHDVS